MAGVWVLSGTHVWLALRILLLPCLPQPEHEWNSLCHNFFNSSCLAQEQTKSQFKKIVNFFFEILKTKLRASNVPIFSTFFNFPIIPIILFRIKMERNIAKFMNFVLVDVTKASSSWYEAVLCRHHKVSDWS